MTKAPFRAPWNKNEQRAIPPILGTLDDKIELNRRMSETLEGMARALFKSWFVDFDPFRAKADGRTPDLLQPLADLFPARLVDSELGEIPEGWEVETLGHHFDAVKGVSYKGERSWRLRHAASQPQLGLREWRVQVRRYQVLRRRVR
jgi:type I restriction enzyme, S subunit